jgi:hypothetical protein
MDDQKTLRDEDIETIGGSTPRASVADADEDDVDTDETDADADDTDADADASDADADLDDPN